MSATPLKFAINANALPPPNGEYSPKRLLVLSIDWRPCGSLGRNTSNPEPERWNVQAGFDSYDRSYDAVVNSAIAFSGLKVDSLPG